MSIYNLRNRPSDNILEAETGTIYMEQRELKFGVQWVKTFWEYDDNKDSDKML